MNAYYEEKLDQLREKAEKILSTTAKDKVIPEINDINQLAHDLSVYQVELELQNEELRNANQLLEKARDSFAQLYNQAPVGYLTLSKQGIILRSNQTFADLVAEEHSNLIGKPLAQFMTNSDQRIFLGRFKAIYKNPLGKSLDVRFQKKDGSTFIGQITSREVINSVLFSANNSESEQLLVIVTDITNRKEMEEALLLSETRLAQAQTVAQMGNWELDLKTNHMWGSPGAFRVYGLEHTSSILPYDQVRNIPFAEDRAFMDAAMHDLIHKNKKYDIEFRIHRKNDNEIRVIHAMAKLVVDAAGKPEKILGVIQDVTEQKLAQDALKQSELQFRTLFNQAAVGVVITDVKSGNFLKTNQRFSEIFGYSAEELITLNFSSITHPEDLALSISNMKALLNEDIRDFSMEKRYITKTGAEVWALITVSAMWESGEPPTSYVGIVQDITKRKLFEQRLQDSLQFLRTLIDTIPNPIFFKDIKGRYTGCNTLFAEKVLGLNKDQIIGRTVLEMKEAVSQELAGKYHQQDLKLLNEPGIQIYDAKVKCADHKFRDYTFYKATFLDANNNVSGLVGIMLDITDRKKMEEELRRSEKRYRSIVQTATDAIIMADSAGNIIAWNHGAQLMFQYSEAEILGKPLTILMADYYQDPHSFGMQYLAQGGEPRFIGQTIQTYAKRKDNTEFPIELALSSWQEEQGMFFTGIIRDITERKEFEAQLQYQSTHDSLTGLYNRSYYEIEVERLQKSRLFPISLIVIDVDGLKQVNDTQGHDFGDELLRQAAHIMKATFRPEDMIARIGGDEFVVILPETDESVVQTAVQRLIKNLEHQNNTCFGSTPLSLSIGFATCVDHNCRISEIFKKADWAMYRDKDQKRKSEI